MNFYILTLFPQMIQSAMSHSIIGKAQSENKINIECINIRDFAGNKHKQVDDYPYGGGAGMVMQPQPIYDAYHSIVSKKISTPRVIYMSPQGKTFSQSIAKDLAKEENLIILCGHYEGIDQRVIDEIVTDEISIGDYILTGGELAAMVVIDAVSRLIPGVLGKVESFEEESFSNHLLEYPQYTRPPVFKDRKVPEVLLSGNHAKIEKWRREQSLLRTWLKRPDLLEKADLTPEDIKYINQLKMDNFR
ncbi:MAG: tRNA (guanine37-N1)-methyltransferase [Epulopiscium sp.]|jgi:tRNA (guanine37-N1)-methyltransferase|uniref:tRNA (guanine-N(1)-)-methyltransferase n=1 Tax=Defluviitalea raffinosedens TaxID=1450156 RepID=A0A7C8HHP3_9FIRM|nr:tRNA (guanosine(37)-N1)-methyltransferase TrmD [Defluviitalea raffinosedens]MBZ4669302.1 trmD [Defluviitaleaceae bacterium]MDK2788592.1 tRNA (guanine37-N1)-methyltransferase [Candidatus Epulonipiscium sp.]KAE9637173.1 tRNA (guanosine(37)-N1)-methyltransferase TrmD [Defluviitalea raffinosedens]MBM7686523.1 tRNA (guanine37-N1)-methyltransferase [Defluviitalea raffinosedens]HHW66800.1 tRNA (guanosine(37)-N1)-methyltransferase TrmD [Candidatus Epulonipiscium sp.]